MEFYLKDKVVVITGGSSGIGKAVADGFAKEGAKIAICGRDPIKLASVFNEFETSGYDLLTKTIDVRNVTELENLASCVVEKYGKIDVWINNAGMNFRKPFNELTEVEWDILVETNLKSVYYGSSIAASHMKKTGSGVIINTSSFTSLTPTGGLALYSATKAATNSLTQTLATELAGYGIRVVGIIPGYIITALTEKNAALNYDSLISSIPMKRLGVPEDLVPAYLFLASDLSSYITGINLSVAGGKLTTQNPHWGWDQMV